VKAEYKSLRNLGYRIFKEESNNQILQSITKLKMRFTEVQEKMVGFSDSVQGANYKQKQIADDAGV
jgi:hypothetical protein